MKICASSGLGGALGETFVRLILALNTYVWNSQGSNKRSGLADTDEEAPPGLKLVVNNVSVVTAPLSRAEQEQRRWIDKPNSLCFGLGNVTILTVAIDIPKVLTPVLSCLGYMNVPLEGEAMCGLFCTQ